MLLLLLLLQLDLRVLLGAGQVVGLEADVAGLHHAGGAGAAVRRTGQRGDLEMINTLINNIIDESNFADQQCRYSDPIEQ